MNPYVVRCEVRYGSLGEYLDIHAKLNEICKERGWAKADFFMPMTGKVNDLIAEYHYPDFETFDRERNEKDAGPDVMSLIRRGAELVVQGTYHHELLERVPGVTENEWDDGEPEKYHFLVHCEVQYGKMGSYLETEAELNGICRKHGWREGNLFVPVFGRINKVLAHYPYMSLEAFDTEGQAKMSDPDAMAVMSRGAQLVAQGSYERELVVPVPGMND